MFYIVCVTAPLALDHSSFILSPCKYLPQIPTETPVSHTPNTPFAFGYRSISREHTLPNAFGIGTGLALDFGWGINRAVLTVLANSARFVKNLAISREDPTHGFTGMDACL
jgi:hypothetical protein